MLLKCFVVLAHTASGYVITTGTASIARHHTGSSRFPRLLIIESRLHEVVANTATAILDDTTTTNNDNNNSFLPYNNGMP